MRSGLVILPLLAAFCLAPRCALAEDAGDSATDDRGSEDSGAADGPAEEAPVVACDGALCDTLQGRPTCAIDSRSPGHSADDPSWIGCVVVAVAGCVGRRKGVGQRGVAS